MSVINMIKMIKRIHPEDVILINMGKFYNVYGKDSYIVAYLFSYKIKKIEDNIYTCGFPDSSLNRVMSKLEQEKINYIVVDRRNDYEKDEESDNGNLNRYNECFQKAKENISYKIRIENINKFLLECNDKQKLKEILKKIESVINEGRKV